MNSASRNLKPKLGKGLAMVLFCVLCSGPFFRSTANAQLRPDLYTIIFALGYGFNISTNQVFPGDNLVVQWSGGNNGTYCIPEFPPCIEVFGPAYGPWQDGVFLYNGTTNRLLGTGTFAGWLPPHGGYDLEGIFRIPSDLTPGVYGIEIRIDYQAGTTNGVIQEQNERNNADGLSGILRVRPTLAMTGIRRLDDHSVWLQLSGSVTQQVRIQVSQTLTSNTWTDLTNVSGFRGTIELRDDAATNTTRFYRACSP